MNPVSSASDGVLQILNTLAPALAALAPWLEPSSPLKKPVSVGIH